VHLGWALGLSVRGRIQWATCILQGEDSMSSVAFGTHPFGTTDFLVFRCELLAYAQFTAVIDWAYCEQWTESVGYECFAINNLHLWAFIYVIQLPSDQYNWIELYHKFLGSEGRILFAEFSIRYCWRGRWDSEVWSRARKMLNAPRMPSHHGIWIRCSWIRVVGEILELGFGELLATDWEFLFFFILHCLN
jgi:hypothetical protein